MKRILVADNSEIITTLLTSALGSAGYEVSAATDGIETYEMGKAGEYDLVILDQLMPGLLGLEVFDPSNPLQLLERLRPVVLEQTGEGTIGEQLAPCLTSGAVVGLIGGVDDPLHG